MQILLNESESEQYLKDLAKPTSYIKRTKADKEFQQPPYQNKPERMNWKPFILITHICVNKKVQYSTLETILNGRENYSATTNQLKAKLRSMGVDIVADGTLSWKDK